MIKRYSELNKKEKEKLGNFMKQSIEELDSICLSRVYDNGEGVLIYFNDNDIVGKLNVVLEVAKELNTAYFHMIVIDNDSNLSELSLRELIIEGKNISDKYGADKYYIASREEYIEVLLKNIGIEMEYSAFNMVLEDRNKKEEVLELKPLKASNKEKYLKIYNDAFSDMPHGTYLDYERLDEHLKKIDESNYSFIVCHNKKELGFMECTIENNEGKFDIGLCKEYRQKGFGKRLLETAVDFLNKKNVERIALTVIEKNSVAFNMYKKRGFIIENTISKWAQL